MKIWKYIITLIFIIREKISGNIFLEFLMIFLAVTMGFFAETIRENIKEHGQAKEYAAKFIYGF
jgi:hypothetical protein